MNIQTFRLKIKQKLLDFFINGPRRFKYKLMSDISVNCKIRQPTLFSGYKNFSINKSVIFGVQQASQYYTNYCYLEVRRPTGKIVIGEGTAFNNNVCIMSNGSEIRVGQRCLIGLNVEIFDSDFHRLNPLERGGNNANSRDVIIEDDVFLGNGVKVLKGVRIGASTIVGAGSIVTSDLPNGVIAVGNPAKVIRAI